MAGVFAFLFRRNRSPKAPCRPRGRESRGRLSVETLEDRLTPNNRFVVPLDVPADRVNNFHAADDALITPGLVSGNVIEIKQGSEPGGISALPAVANLTIRGEAAVGPTGLPEVPIHGNQNVTAAQAGLVLQNLNLVIDATLSLQAKASLVGNRITVSTGTGSALVVTATNALIANNQIIGTSAPTFIHLTTSAGSQNLVAGNVFRGGPATTALIVDGVGPSTDVFRDNIVIDGEGNTGSGAIGVGTTVNGLTIQHNTFRDADFSFLGISISLGAQNINILQNTLDLPGTGAGNSAISLGGGPSGVTTTFTISGNLFNVGAGFAIQIFTPTSGTVRAKIQANDFLTAAIGVKLETGGSGYANIDLGGGTEGSAGGNNFRFVRSAATFNSGAVVIGSETGTVAAQKNIFGTIGPAAANLDGADTAGLATVTTTGNLTANAAFVQALFVRFLFRTGDVANPADAGAFVNQLNAGANPAVIVNAISRSAEAFGFVVDDLFHQILNRDADPAGKTTWVNQLVAGATLESVKGGFFASAEYTSRFAADRAFVVSLYATVLGRTGSDAEYNSWIALIPTQGRAGVATAILGSSEAHGQAASKLYISLLKRPASAAEISVWANSGQDELTIRTGIAASPEGQGII